MEWNNKTVEAGDWLLLKNGFVVKVARVLKNNLGYFYAKHESYDEPIDYDRIVKKVEVKDA